MSINSLKLTANFGKHKHTDANGNTVLNIGAKISAPNKVAKTITDIINKVGEDKALRQINLALNTLGLFAKADKVKTGDNTELKIAVQLRYPDKAEKLINKAISRFGVDGALEMLNKAQKAVNK